LLCGTLTCCKTAGRCKEESMKEEVSHDGMD
jgi:hypothetical protein